MDSLVRCSSIPSDNILLRKTQSVDHPEVFMKGQSGEWLMTYGWALLIVIIVAAALFFMGVFDPETFRQQWDEEWKCVEWNVTGCFGGCELLNDDVNENITFIDGEYWYYHQCFSEPCVTPVICTEQQHIRRLVK